MTEGVTFLKREDGKISVVGTWPASAEFSRAALEDAPFMHAEEGYVEISVYNGCAFYEIVGKGNGYGMPEVVTARLINGHIGFDP